METGGEVFAKQFNNTHIVTNLRPIVINYNPSQKTDYFVQKRASYLQTDEPIDLTQGPSRPIKIEKCEEGTTKRKLKSYPLSEQSQLQGFFKDVIELQATESKQAEILKAAKSLFSKRTRTLYHWMYPHTPKQQIKLAVANSWDNLGVQEKQFYISQVLVRFGFPQCNLMVNPQLGGIKELPPLPDHQQGGSSSTRELQTAISSISNIAPSAREMSRKRLGRPPGSKNKRHKSELLTYKLTKDFQDDPELSKELEKFAISFDCFK